MLSNYILLLYRAITLYTFFCFFLFISSFAFLFTFSIFFLFCRSKRAAYKYAKDRGAIASRWCWLSTQISELDYKIRQHTDLRKHIRETKGIVQLEEVNVEGHQISGSIATYNNGRDSDTEECESSARVRPFTKSLFRKRKLVQISNLHHVSKKAARPR